MESGYQMFIKDGKLNIETSKGNEVTVRVYDVRGVEVAAEEFAGGSVIDIEGARGVIIVKITDKETGDTEVRKMLR